MRRTSVAAIVAAVVATVAAVGVVPVTAASARPGTPRVRYYEGPMSGGGRLRIRVVVTDGEPYLSLLLLSGPYSCEDGTQGKLEDDGVGWVPRGPIVQAGRLELSENWQSVAFDVSGHLGSRRGFGTVTFLWPALTTDEQAAQLCTLGEVTWTVERTSGEDFPFSRVSVQATGRRIIAVGVRAPGHGRTRSARSEAGIRHYRGRTSQDRGMSARTIKVDAGIAISFLSMGFLLPCEDGTQNEGGIRPLAYFDAPRVMSPGALDLDIAPRTDSIFGVALHVHGQLDAHAGSGTFSMAEPSLTDDRYAQLCTSGEKTWRLWRTDTGV